VQVYEKQASLTIIPVSLPAKEILIGRNRQQARSTAARRSLIQRLETTPYKLHTCNLEFF